MLALGQSFGDAGDFDDPVELHSLLCAWPPIPPSSCVRRHVRRKIDLEGAERASPLTPNRQSKPFDRSQLFEETCDVFIWLSGHYWSSI
jgi:hypothetical protein